ncbi:MAG: winged helix-turn-helix transcriptional regulator [Candidatus Liptonbacteria bacterium]|nr:winged helix-turn-helix transcriptional regulator [Candidatus Liptonbacteria bacterium]
MREFEKTLKAVANRRRLAILKYLKSNDAASVGEIAREIGLSLRSTSRHLAVLSACDIVERDQRGLQVFYCLACKLHTTVRQVISLL